MRTPWAALFFVITAVLFIPALACANSGDFSGGVAIGTSYAGIDTAPTDGLIVQGSASLGVSSPASGSIFEIDTPANTAGPGTVAVTSSSGTVTGTGTAFISSFQNGDTITANSETHTITAISSNTSMTTDNWANTASGQTYTLAGGQRLVLGQNGGIIIGGGTNGNGSPRLLAINRSFTNNGGNNAIVGVIADLSLANTSAAYVNAVVGLDGAPTVAASNTQNWTSSLGLAGIISNPSVTSGASGTITAVNGVEITVSNNSSTATVTNAYGLNLNAINNSGTMTSAAGIAVNNVSAATNNTQLLLGTNTIPSGNFGIYDSNTNNSYFAGSVGIANTSPSHLLHVGSSSASGIVMELQNSSGACTYNPGASSVTVTCSSDMRLKTDIQDSKGALAWVDDMRVRDFTVKATGERKRGVVAQEVMLKHPEMVHQGAEGVYMVDEPNPWNLVKAIQEQQSEIDELKRTIAQLKQQK